MNRLAWHGFAFALPEGWEVTAYRLAPKRGAFHLHERLRERGQLAWMQTAGRPDPEGLARQILERQLGEPGRREAAILRLGDWTVAHAGPERPFQAIAFVPHDQRLLHWTFPAWTGPEGPWRALLEGWRADPGDERRWALFGAEVLLPRRFTPVEVEARPGAVRLEFADPAGLAVTVRRFGLARGMLAERPLSAWLRRAAFADRARLEQVQETVRRGLPAVRAAFTIRGERTLDRIAWRRWPGEAWWWHDAAANRIHAIEQVGPPRVPRLDLSHAA